MSMDMQSVSWPGWKTVRLIGRGSFGEVYEIERDMFGDLEKAALKVITIPQNASDIDEMYNDGFDEESITSTFQNHLRSIVAEYSLMRKMNGCANVVNCDDVRYVQHDDGIGWDIFIKMELLTPLTKALPQIVPDATVIKVAKDICIALELCKKHGIIHRDIKPQNIFVSEYGDYKLGDFGIAKTVERTMGGTKIGTYKYMAPEVYNNQPYGAAADLYSLGLVLYWLLNERRMPFMPPAPAKLSLSMDEQARIRRLAGEQFPEPKHGSKELKAIVMKACAYKVEDRYSSAAEMLADLERPYGEPTASPAPVSGFHQVSTPVLQDIPSVNEDEEETIGIFTKTVRAQDKDEAATVLQTERVTGTSASEENVAAKLEFSRQENPNPTKNKSVNFSASKQSKRNLIIVGAVAVALVVLIATLLPSIRKENADNQMLIQNQDDQTAEVHKSPRPTNVPAENSNEISTANETRSNRIVWKRIETTRPDRNRLDCAFMCDSSQEYFTVLNPFDGETYTASVKRLLYAGCMLGEFEFNIPNDITLVGWHEITLHYDGVSSTIEFYLDYSNEEEGWVVNEWNVVG